MKNKKILVFGIVIALSIVGIFLVTALSNDERIILQGELDELIQYLEDNNYSWLINYSGNMPVSPSSSIEVYTENNDTLITKFENITAENWYRVYLSNLTGEQDVFDLLVKGRGVEEIPREILLKKMRIDEIKKELNKNGG